MGKKKDETVVEPGAVQGTPTEVAVEPMVNPEPAAEPTVEKKNPTVQVDPRISLREFIGIYGRDTKVMARIKALKLVMDVAWLSTNKTTAQWHHFCDIVTHAPVNEMKLSEWIKLATDGGMKEQKARYAGILKQLEV